MPDEMGKLQRVLVAAPLAPTCADGLKVLEIFAPFPQDYYP
jgi:hypothetical protein